MDATSAQQLGRAMRYYRDQRGLTQTELGQACGCTQQAISEYEKGHVESIDVALVITASHVLGMNLLGCWRGGATVHTLPLPNPAELAAAAAQPAA